MKRFLTLRITELRFRPSEAPVEGLLRLNSPPLLLRFIPLLAGGRNDRGRRVLILPLETSTECAESFPLLAECRGRWPLSCLRLSSPPIFRLAVIITIGMISIPLEVNLQRVTAFLLRIVSLGEDGPLVGRTHRRPGGRRLGSHLSGVSSHCFHLPYWLLLLRMSLLPLTITTIASRRPLRLRSGRHAGARDPIRGTHFGSRHRPCAPRKGRLRAAAALSQQRPRSVGPNGPKISRRGRSLRKMATASGPAGRLLGAWPVSPRRSAREAPDGSREARERATGAAAPVAGATANSRARGAHRPLALSAAAAASPALAPFAVASAAIGRSSIP